MTDTQFYDATARARGMAVAPPDPMARLAAVVDGRDGWALGAGAALHIDSDVQVVVDGTGPLGRPYRVALPGETDAWYHATPDNAVRLVETRAEPRYTVEEAAEAVARRQCAAHGHEYLIGHDEDGQPCGLSCQRCPQTWPLADPDRYGQYTETVGELVEALRVTAEYTGLPAEPGWSWFDALTRHAPGIAEKMAAGQAPAPPPPGDGAGPGAAGTPLRVVPAVPDAVVFAGPAAPQPAPPPDSAQHPSAAPTQRPPLRALPEPLPGGVAG